MKFLKRWFVLSYLTLKYVVFLVLRTFRVYPYSYHKIIRLYLEEAGGAFIKLGQILALRYEILPPEFCLELAELFDNVAPMPYPLVESIVESEFGRNTKEIFTLFEESPIAAASFAQVHRAILNDGKEVAVKVQRPGLLQKVREDFKFLRFASFIFSPLFHFKAFSFREILAEMEKSTYEELDFRKEKDSAEQIRCNEDDKKIFIPKTYTEYTTEKVLVQDYVKGIKLNDILRAKRNQVPNEKFDEIDCDLDQIALDVVSELARQYFKTGIFHCDPHPGNIIIMEDGRIAFVDFGIVGRVKKYDRALFWNFIQHITKVGQDPQKACEAFLRLGLQSIEQRIRYLSQNKLETVQLFFDLMKDLGSTYQKTLSDIMENWAGSIGKSEEPLYERSAAVGFIKAMKLAEEYGVHFQRSLIPFIRSLVIGDMMAMQISSTFKINQALRNFADKNKEFISELEDYLRTDVELDEKFKDLWDEDARESAKEYIAEWYEGLTESSPALVSKIKQPVELLRKAI